MTDNQQIAKPRTHPAGPETTGGAPRSGNAAPPSKGTKLSLGADTEALIADKRRNKPIVHPARGEGGRMRLRLGKSFFDKTVQDEIGRLMGRLSANRAGR